MFACIHVPGLKSGEEAALAHCAEQFSPRVEPGRERVVIDIRGLRSLLGTPADIAAAMSLRVAEAGLHAHIAIAGNANAATAAAAGISGITVIGPGDEARILAPLRIALLDPGEETLDVFSAWGVHTFGDLAELPDEGLAQRLGSDGVDLWKLARGTAPRPLLPVEEAPRFEASIALEHALDTLEPLSFLLSRLLHEICERLQTYGLAANRMDLALTLEDRGEFHRSLQVPFATREAASFLRLLQYDLAAHPPPAAIAGVHLKAYPVKPRAVQHGLFIPQAPEPEKLELTMQRIKAVVGEQNAGSPELIDTHRPGAFRMNRFESPPEDKKRQTRTAEPHLSIRIYRPAMKAKVTMRSARPHRISAQGVTGNIGSCAGPWRTSGDWWTDTPWFRDEWDIAIENGGLYRIYCERDNSWFVEGNYD